MYQLIGGTQKDEEVSSKVNQVNSRGPRSRATLRGCTRQEGFYTSHD